MLCLFILLNLTGEKDEFVQVGPKKFLFPGTFKKHADHFYNFKARADDIWIATYPRSGTTWTQELTWMIANDLDYDGAQRDFLTKRSPFFEYGIFVWFLFTISFAFQFFFCSKEHLSCA